MGLLPEIRRKGYMVREVRIVDRSGKRVAGFPADAFARMTRGRYVSLPRGELAASIFGKIEGKVETIFGDSVEGIEQTERSVHVTFASGGMREIRSRGRSGRASFAGPRTRLRRGKPV